MFSTLPWLSLLGGVLLGISASLLLIFNGKIAGISGILGGIVIPKKGDIAWRWLFAFSMIIGGFAASLFFPNVLPSTYSASTLTLVLAGLLVGVGTKLGNGCTSGHGICGIGRLSLRSLVATLIFMIVAAITVFIRLHILA